MRLMNPEHVATEVLVSKINQDANLIQNLERLFIFTVVTSKRNADGKQKPATQKRFKTKHITNMFLATNMYCKNITWFNT